MKKKSITESNLHHGVITALITPFYKGAVDFVSLKKLVTHQLDNGIKGFVINGTTAESPTLLPEEVEKIFNFVRGMTGDKFNLIIGTGTNSTLETAKKTLWAKKLGAKAALVVVPYYNKPPQRGLFYHFKIVAEKTKVPIILYNVPGRTIVSMSENVTVDLSKLPFVCGIKEASGNLSYLKKIRNKVPDSFSLLSGDDNSAVDFVYSGGHGVISVISHVIPKEFTEMIERGRARDRRVKGDYLKFFKLNKLLGIESNPIPVKAMLKEMGIIRSAELRLPLVEVLPENLKAIQLEMKNLGLI